MYRDRDEAGRRLVESLSAYRGSRDAVVAAIPRGGVVVGAVVARALGLPLEALLTKKIGHPLQPEYAIGVVNLSHELVDEEVVEREGISDEYIRGEVARLRELLRRRHAAYHEGRAPLSLRGRTVILVDDGLATGRSMEAAVRLAREEGAVWVVVAVPVAPPETLSRLRPSVDELVCPLAPEDFRAIGQFYQDFTQVEDEEAMRLLRESANATAALAGRGGAARPPAEEDR